MTGHQRDADALGGDVEALGGYRTFADRDEAIRAEERERIALAIEAQPMSFTTASAKGAYIIAALIARDTPNLSTSEGDD